MKNRLLVNQLELRLKRYPGLKHLFFVGNVTVALQLTIKGLTRRGEVLTTPFFYVTTTSSLVWEGCSMVFENIDLDTLLENLPCAATGGTTRAQGNHAYFRFKDNLLVINVADDKAYQEICAFLGEHPPYDAMPWKNKTHESN